MSELFNIGRINSPAPISVAQRAGKEDETTATEGFAGFMANALNNVIATDATDKATNIGLMTGDLMDLHTATIAAEKAQLTLQLTLQIRNRVVDSYNEIMRMQV